VRVYRLDHPARSFHPGDRTEPRGRFHFFESTSGERVPVLYAAEGENAAISESVFHDLPVGGGGARPVIPESRLAAYGLARLRAHRDLLLVELHGFGLRRLDLRAENLTDTGPEEYLNTVKWAAALHRAVPEADGLVWMSRQFNAEEAVVLFGDRVGEADLDEVAASRPLSSGRGREVVDRAANASVPGIESQPKQRSRNSSSRQGAQLSKATFMRWSSESNSACPPPASTLRIASSRRSISSC